MIKHYKNARVKRHIRIRSKIVGTGTRPRLTVFRSNRGLYVQIIDDEKGVTLLGIRGSKASKGVNKIESAHTLGKLVAQKAHEKNIKRVVFDRSGYMFHGRIKALAQGLKEGQLVY